MICEQEIFRIIHFLFGQPKALNPSCTILVLNTFRIDLEHLCTLPFPEELDYADVLTTEVELLYCGFNIIFGKGKVKEEPRIRDYAK